MAIRIATKLTAGIGATVYTVPAGKSATVSVQVQNPTGFILAAQQTAISANPLINTVGANTAAISAVFTPSSTTFYMKHSTRTLAFNSTSGSLSQNGILYTPGATGLVAQNFNSNYRSPPSLDYRFSTDALWFIINDTNYGGTRAAQMPSNTYANFAVNPTEIATARSGSTGYTPVACAMYSSTGMAVNSIGYFTRFNGYGTPSTTGGKADVSSSDPISGQTNFLYSFCNNNGYAVGFQAIDSVLRVGNGVGAFIGLYKTAAAPAIATHTNWSDLMDQGSCHNFNMWTLSGPANGTCPMWVRWFNNTYYFGMSDNTLWKTTTDPYQYSGTGSTSSRGALTCTQVTLPADVNVASTKPYVASATQMHFASTTSTFPRIMNTSEVFSDFPNVSYPSELSFASATVPNPKIITKYGSTINEYTIVDTSSVYKTVANYSVLEAESYLINGRYGDFERTGLVLNSGDKLIAVEPTDSNCIVTVYGYEE